MEILESQVPELEQRLTLIEILRKNQEAVLSQVLLDIRHNISIAFIKKVADYKHQKLGQEYQTLTTGYHLELLHQFHQTGRIG